MHWRRKWAAVYGVAQSRTQLKRLSSSRSSVLGPGLFPHPLRGPPHPASVHGAGQTCRKRAWRGASSSTDQLGDEIMDFVKSRGGVEYAKARLQEYVGQAVEAIAVLGDSVEKKCLTELAHFTAIRDN